MKYLFIGGDKRMRYAARLLSADRLFMGNYPEPSGKYPAVVLPVPLPKSAESIPAPLEDTAVSFDVILQYAENGAVIFAGGACEKLKSFCAEKGFLFADYFACESLTLKNAALTAQAAVVILSQSGERAVLGSRALITGYGRIAKYLARYLRELGAGVCAAARSPAQRAAARLDGFDAVEPDCLDEKAGQLDCVFNTAPAHIFGEKFFDEFNGVYIELATLDGEREKALCESRGIKYIRAGGLPGKHFPETAGKFIAEEILLLSAELDLK